MTAVADVDMMCWGVLTSAARHSASNFHLPICDLRFMPASSDEIQRAIDTFRRATTANQQTPSRRGNVIVLTPESADDVLVTADLHGHRRNYESILGVADLDRHPRRHLILQEVCHGGPCYPEQGGCMSHALLEDVARLKVQYPDRVHFLLSNHELSELIDYPIVKGRRMLNLLFRCGLHERFGAAAELVRQAYLPFLRSCPLAVRLPGGVFICHSLPEGVDHLGFDATIFERPLEQIDFQERGPVFELVWGRDYRPENAAAFAKLVQAETLVNGHEPCPDGFRVPNPHQIILDCCGERTSYLLLPVNESASHAQLVERIAPLP